MNNNEFDQFKKSIEHERELEFYESSWDGLKHRLDETSRRKPLSFLAWWILGGLAMLSLLIGNIFLFSNLKSSRKLNEEIQSQMQSFSISKKLQIQLFKII